MARTPTGPAVLVTGASRGLGYHTAVHLAGQGCRVFGGVRSEDAAARLSRESGGRITPLTLDVTEPDQIDAAMDQVAADVGQRGLTGLVNNAGIHEPGPVEQIPLAEVDAQLRVNLLGPMAVIKASLPLLRHGHGRIVNVSSINAVLPVPFAAAYNASKAGLESLSDSLRLELKPWGIPVIVVRPGPHDTDVRSRGVESWRRRRQELTTGGRALYAEAFKMQEAFMAVLDGRAGHPDDVAEAVHRALTDLHPQTKYSVGPDMDRLLALAALPDTEREEALMQAVSSLLEGSPV